MAALLSPCLRPVRTGRRLWGSSFILAMRSAAWRAHARAAPP